MKATLHGFEAWLKTRNLSETTPSDYVAHVRRAFRLASPLDRLRDRKLSPKHRRVTLAALRRWAQYAQDTRLEKALSDTSPVVQGLPKGERVSLRRPFTREEWKALIKEIGQDQTHPKPVRAVCGIMATRGLRVSDVLRMTRQATLSGYTKNRAVLKVKGERHVEYDMAMSHQYLEWLLEEKKDWSIVADLIAPKARDRKQAARVEVMRALKEIGAVAGLDPSEIYTHRLRRTVATQFILRIKGDPLAIIKLQKWMGWSSLETARGYVDHVLQEDLDSVGRGLLED